MRKKLSQILILLMCLFCLSAYADQPATDLTLQVEGRAPVIQNDVVSAREEAVKNASEKAIMQAAAKILLDKYEDENFQALKSILLGRTDRYIKNTRIISEKRLHNDFIAHVQVVVALAHVSNDLLQMGMLPDQRIKEGVVVSFTLKGMKKYSDFNRMKTFLQKHPKIVKSTYPCHLEWQQAHCDLVLVGEVQSLVAELEKTGRYSMESINNDYDRVEINLNVKEEVR